MSSDVSRLDADFHDWIHCTKHYVWEGLFGVFPCQLSCTCPSWGSCFHPSVLVRNYMSACGISVGLNLLLLLSCRQHRIDSVHSRSFSTTATCTIQILSYDSAMQWHRHLDLSICQSVHLPVQTTSVHVCLCVGGSTYIIVCPCGLYHRQP